jgi:hypothetical protein
MALMIAVQPKATDMRPALQVIDATPAEIGQEALSEHGDSVIFKTATTGTWVTLIWPRHGFYRTGVSFLHTTNAPGRDSFTSRFRTRQRPLSAPQADGGARRAA